MSRSRHTEAQMIGALKQVEAGRKVEDVAREVGGVGAGEATLRVSATACFAGPLGRACEPQASASGVSGGRADDPAEEAETLRACGTAAASKPSHSPQRPRQVDRTRRLDRIFMPMGGPQAHGNSKHQSHAASISVKNLA